MTTVSDFHDFTLIDEWLGAFTLHGPKVPSLGNLAVTQNETIDIHDANRSYRPCHRTFAVYICYESKVAMLITVTQPIVSFNILIDSTPNSSTVTSVRLNGLFWY